MHKTIWIDTSIHLKNKTGIGCYILMLIKCFDKLNLNYKIQGLDIDEKTKRKSIWVTIWLNSVEYVNILRKSPNFFISPCCLMPYLTCKKTKYIDIIHDLCSFKEGYMNKGVAFMHRFGIFTALKKADTIVTVSNTIRQEILDKFNVSPERVKVIYNTIGEHFIKAENRPIVLEKYSIEKGKYILSVATLNKHKNIPALIKAFEMISLKYPDLKLVLVGDMGNENREKLTKHPNIIFTGYIKDEELPTLYKNAMFYVFPSLYEGFGIPLIEAQQMGCPVLCSDIPVFKEVCGNSAEYSGTVAESIANKMEYLINNEQRRNELRALGYENVKRFDIERIAEQVMEVFDEKNI